MILPSHMYRDPQQVAMRHEEEHLRKEAACGECRERASFHWYGEEIISCELKHQQYGRRCEHFRKRPITESED